MTDIVKQLKRRIKELKLNYSKAARRIDVRAVTLSQHLRGVKQPGKHVINKYLAWLNSPAGPEATDMSGGAGRKATRSSGVPGSRCNKRAVRQPHLVVDLFCGCGGLSLGFDAYENGSVFRTVLAIDLEQAMVDVFNDNVRQRKEGEHDVCRVVDLAGFRNEAEVLAFYLEHYARLESDKKLINRLNKKPGIALSEFKEHVARADAWYCSRLEEIKRSPDYKHELKRLGRGVATQSSVQAFQAALALPLTITTPSSLLWWDSKLIDKHRRTLKMSSACEEMSSACEEIEQEFESEWVWATRRLTERSGDANRGAATSAVERIHSFAGMLSTKVGQDLRDVWVTWRAERECRCREKFENESTQEALRCLYEEHGQISVLLGGPPCQGFSKVGRGKIRSLRDRGLQVHEDQDAGDARNKLLHKYVLFVSALKPRVFLFENVRAFQAAVRTSGGTYKAHEVLAKEIEKVSSGDAKYETDTCVIFAHEHLVPQFRERFFMAGVRCDSGNWSEGCASQILDLDKRKPVPLRVALDGLPDAFMNGLSSRTAANSHVREKVRPSKSGCKQVGESEEYMKWIGADPPQGKSPLGDANTAVRVRREPREDDGKFFSLLGPGKRWMDYRCDGSETLKLLQHLMKDLNSNRGAWQKITTLKESDLDSLHQRLDGSLSLRLLLECISPLGDEKEHHLLSPKYLSKQAGNHGDWLKRLHPDEPSRTIVSHMAKDTYGFVHPSEERTLSLREAARIQTFPDWFKFEKVGLVEGFRMIGNAVPPLLSHQFAERIVSVLGVNAR